MKTENDIDMAAEAAVKPTPAPKAKPKAKKPAAKKGPTAKQLQAAADKAAKAEVKAAEDKVKADEKAAADKEKASKALVVKAERGMKPLIAAGLKAMTMVGNGNQGWTIAAYKMRELCVGTPLVFKDVAADAFGVAANTASKLANAGEMLIDLLETEGEKHNWLAHMPMNNINNLSTISRMTDKKIDKGIDLEFIKIDATEKVINDFNRDYDDRGIKMVVKDVPSTHAADADDAGEVGVGPLVSESETPAELQARILVLTSTMDDNQALALIEAIEVQHNLVVASE